MENEIENIDSSNDEIIETTDSENSENEDSDEQTVDTTDYKALLEAERKKNSQLFERLKKGGNKQDVAKPKPQSEHGLSRDEARLIAQGLSDDDIEDVKFISDRFGIGMLEAAKSNKFNVLKAEREAEAKSQAASVRASNGSKTKSVATFDTATDRDEHKALFDKSMGR